MVKDELDFIGNPEKALSYIHDQLDVEGKTILNHFIDVGNKMAKMLLKLGIDVLEIMRD